MKRTKPTIFSAARDGIVEDIVELLMTGEIDVNDWAPLHYACLHGRKEAVKCLIEQNADVNMMTKGIMTEKVLFFYLCVTPLIIAVRKGYNAIVSELLRNGADPKKLDLIGQSAFKYANAKTLAVLNFETAGEVPQNDVEEEEEKKDEE